MGIGQMIANASARVAIVAALAVIGVLVAVGVAVVLLTGDSGPDPGGSVEAVPIGEPVSVELASREAVVVTHESGASIEVPAGAISESTTVTVAEVEPPEGGLAVRRAFDFQVGDVELTQPVTIRIPFELEAGEDASDVHALHWREEAIDWEPVPGTVDESTGTIAVTTSDLSIFSWAWVKVDAGCEVSPATVDVGEGFTVTAAGSSLTAGNIKVYMKPEIKGPGVPIPEQDGTSEVATVGKGEELELTVSSTLDIPAEYHVRCRIFWETIGPHVELQSEDRPTALVTVEGQAPVDLAVTVPSTVKSGPIGPAIAGHEVTVWFDFGNYGHGPSGPFDIRFYLSRSEGDTDTFVGGWPDVSSKGPGDFLLERSYVLQVPADLAPGPYWLCGQIRRHSPVVDLNEDNDTSCARTYVLPDISGEFEPILAVPFEQPDSHLRMLQSPNSTAYIPFVEQFPPDYWVFVPSELASMNVAAPVAERTVDRRDLYRRLALELMRRPEVLNAVQGDSVASLIGSSPHPDDTFTGVRFNPDALGESATMRDVARLVNEVYSVPAPSTGVWIGFAIEVWEFGTVWGDVKIAAGMYRHIQLEDAQRTLDLLRALDPEPSAEWDAAISDAQRALDVMTSEDEWRKFFVAMKEHEEEITDSHIDLAVAGGVLTGKIVAGLALGKFAILTFPIWIAVADVVQTIHDTDDFWNNLSMATALAHVYERLYSLDVRDRQLGIPDPESHRREILAYTKFKFYEFLYAAADNSALRRGRIDFNDVGANTLDQHVDHILMARDDAFDGAVNALRLGSVEPGQTSLTLAEGEKVQLEQPVLRSGSGRVLTGHEVQWLSSNPFVAMVSESGEVTGGISGEAVITVRGHVRDEFIFDPTESPDGPRVYTVSVSVPQSHLQAGTVTTQTAVTVSYAVVPTYVTAEIAVSVGGSAGPSEGQEQTAPQEPPDKKPSDKEPSARWEFASVSAGGIHTCGVRTDGTVACWGNDRYFQSTPPEGEFASVDAGGVHTCGIRPDGTVECWGSDENGQSTPPEGQFVSVSAGVAYTCGLRTSGSIACWGQDSPGNRPTPSAGEYTSVSAGNAAYYICGLRTDGTVACWAPPHSHVVPPTVPEGKFASLDTGSPHACGVRPDGTVECWGWRDDHGQISPPEGKFVYVSAGGAHTCGIRPDGTVECWGWDEYGQATPPEGEFASISAGRFHTCGLRTDGTVECWGQDEYGQSTPPVGIEQRVRFNLGAQERIISAGGNHTCRLRRDAFVSCWGLNRDDQSWPPPEGQFTSVSAGGAHNCGVRIDGTVSCWGSNGDGQSTPPGGEFTAVSAGLLHTCGVRTDGTVVCWGSNGNGRSTPPEGKFTSVGAGALHTCGVKTDGTVACWGWNRYAQSEPPEGQFASVSAGEGHTCGLRTDGTVECWGWDDFGQSTPPEGQFAAVSAGSAHACGLRTDGTVECWGWNNEGQSTPPEGQFAAVSGGDRHTCAMRTDGTVACWGSDRYNQSAPR